MNLAGMASSVSEMVRSMVPNIRPTMTPFEKDLAVHLRGNESLMCSIRGIVGDRLRSRELSPVPKDPVQCMASMARDKELRWFISRLESIVESPIDGEVKDDGEQPG